MKKQPSRTPPSLAPAPPSEPKTPVDRLAFVLDTNGRPDVERMHAKTKQKLAEILKDPEVAKSLGVSAADAPAAAPMADAIPRELVLACVATLSKLQTVLVSRMTGAPAHIVLSIAPWTPDEQNAIAGPLGNVLNKYAPATLSKYGDEVALLVLIVSTTTAKIEAVKSAAATARPRSVVPMQPAIVDDTQPTPAPAPEGQA